VLKVPLTPTNQPSFSHFLLFADDDFVANHLHPDSG